jgi:hypothetical protein
MSKTDTRRRDIQAKARETFERALLIYWPRAELSVSYIKGLRALVLASNAAAKKSRRKAA